jgi:hypothetical protein
MHLSSPLIFLLELAVAWCKNGPILNTSSGIIASNQTVIRINPTVIDFFPTLIELIPRYLKNNHESTRYDKKHYPDTPKKQKSPHPQDYSS